MVNKSLALLAFTALAAASPSPQLGGLGGLTGLLSPGSKSGGSAAKNSGEPMPDTLSYNKPFEDEEDPHTSSFARSQVPSSTVVKNVPSTARQEAPAYTTSPVTNKNEQPSTYEQPQQQKDETPKAYEQPQQQQDQTPDSYEQPQQQKDETPSTYEQPQQQQDQTPDSYEQPQQQQDQTPDSYEQPEKQQDQTPDTYEQPKQQQQDQTPDAYEEPQQAQQSDGPPKFANESPAPYKRALEQGYGKAEFEKQSHAPSTTAAAAACTPHSDVESFVSSNLPAISSANPAFGKAAESYLSHVSSSSSSIAAAKQTTSAWSAKPYTTPVAQPAVKSSTEKEDCDCTAETHSHAQAVQKQEKTSATTIPTAAATTPLRDSAVPTDAKIFINPLANTTTATPAAEVDAKQNSAYAAESTAPAQDVAPAVTSSVLPYYPTTTGVANMTSGIAAASTGAVKSNNTVPEFEGAASSSHFIGGSVIAAALAAFAFL